MMNELFRMCVETSYTSDVDFTVEEPARDMKLERLECLARVRIALESMDVPSTTEWTQQDDDEYETSLRLQEMTDKAEGYGISYPE